MTEQSAIPSVEQRERALKMLRESNQQLDFTAIALDKLIAMVETDLSNQQYQQFARKRMPKSPE